MTWTRERRAAALLASCAAFPPMKHLHRDRFGDTWETYSKRDERVRKLHELYANAQPELDSDDWREWLSLTPDAAISAAVDELKMGEAA